MSEAASMQSETFSNRDTAVAIEKAPDVLGIKNDLDLLGRIEANFFDLCKCGLRASHALMAPDEYSFSQHFKRYTNAIHQHLRLVSVELYVYLRTALPDGADRAQVIELEAKASTLCHRLVDVLASIELTTGLRPEVRNKALSAITRKLENHFMRETEVLFSIYRRIA
jgi:hypothetical protein